MTAPQKKKLMVVSVLAALAILAVLILWAPVPGSVATACPAQEELKSFLSVKAAGMRQWNAFREIYSFEVEGYRKKAGDYMISFNQGYVNCEIDGTAGFRCDRRDPIFSIYSEGSGGVLESREITVDAASFGIVGQIMCTGV